MLTATSFGETPVPSLFRTLLLGLLVAATPLAAQSREQLVVNAKWLNDHLKDRNLVVLHVGPKPSYDKAHIPGARYVDFHDVVHDEPDTKLSFQLPPADTLRARLAAMGVSSGSRIVVYFADGWVSPSTRVVLTLDHAGFGEATSLLDGGINAWTRAGYSTTTDVPSATVGDLPALKTKAVTVGAEYVRDNLGKPGVAVIDGRAAAFYDGVSEGGPRDARKKGHIKGALSVPFTEITTDSLELKSPEQLRDLFTRAGVKPGDTIIGYCHIGQQATAMLFGARTLGYKVLLYDGSFEDWARRDWPVVVPPGK
jgi:thiosulfate/3-mercaptopyruvate sulfurtransferase